VFYIPYDASSRGAIFKKDTQARESQSLSLAFTQWFPINRVEENAWPSGDNITFPLFFEED